MPLQTPISDRAVAADSAVPKAFVQAAAPEPKGSSYKVMDSARALGIAFSGFVIFFGLLEFWINRDSTNTDGISYLDVASAFARHDWSAAVNAYWSPLYPFLLGIALRLLKPAAYWEFTVAHLVNFLIFAGAAAAFQFFLSRFMLYRSARIASADLVTWSVLPDWSVRALGYTLFLWSSLQLITIAVLSPDMTVELFVYLAAGIVLGMRAKGIARVRDFFLLGIVLGFGYLAKAPMLPIGMVFLAIALFSAGGVKKSIVRISAAVLAMVLVAAPFVLTLSREKGHLTWGDSAKLNYSWYVNHIPRYHWQGTPARYGTPDHPTKELFAEPPVYGFDGPHNSTYPVWYDPSYWNQGVRPVWDWKSILGQVSANLPVYDGVIFGREAAVVVICLLLFLIGGRGEAALADLGDYWFLLIPVAAAFGMYVVVHVEERMIASFVVLIWMALFATVRYRDLPEIQRCASLAVAAVALLTLFTLAESVFGEMFVHGPREILSSSSRSFQWQIASDLHGMGLEPGDKVAWMRPSAFTPKQNYAWARLARVEIVAEVPGAQESQFWNDSPETRGKLFDAVSQTGAAAFVVTAMPSGFPDSGWQPLGKTGYWVHMLR
jgi:hypothetical protein